MLRNTHFGGVVVVDVDVEDFFEPIMASPMAPAIMYDAMTPGTTKAPRRAAAPHQTCFL